MNKKVVLQIGCFLMMFALEMIAAQFDPSSAAFTAFMILSLLMIPAYILVKYLPQTPKKAAGIETLAAEAA